MLEDTNSLDGAHMYNTCIYYIKEFARFFRESTILLYCKPVRRIIPSNCKSYKVEN